MKTNALFATALAAAIAMSPALACPADTSLEDGPAARDVPHRTADDDATRACVVRVAGNPKMSRPKGRAVSCPGPFARRPAERRDAA